MQKINTIINLYPLDIQEKLYLALESNIPILATTNRRGIPGESFIATPNGNYIELIINPAQNILCYTDFKILSLQDAILELMPLEEIQEYASTIPKEDFIEGIGDMLHKIKYQYTAEDIYKYLYYK